MAKRPDVDLFLNIAEHARLNEDELKQIYGNDLVFINNKPTDTQGFMVIKNSPPVSCGTLCGTTTNSLLISFRGSQQPKDWINDFNGWHTTVPYGNYSSDIRVHKGFIKCYKSVRGKILQYIAANKNEIAYVFLTGHSLGGALALLCAVDIQYNYPNLKLEVYTSGAPAVGNKAFARSYNRRVPDTTRTYARKDIVPKLPPKWFGRKLHGGYKHVSKKYAIGPISFWAGLKMYVKVGGKFMDKVTNHSITLYKKWC